MSSRTAGRYICNEGSIHRGSTHPQINQQLDSSPHLCLRQILSISAWGQRQVCCGVLSWEPRGGYPTLVSTHEMPGALSPQSHDHQDVCELWQVSLQLRTTGVGPRILPGPRATGNIHLFTEEHKTSCNVGVSPLGPSPFRGTRAWKCVHLYLLHTSQPSPGQVKPRAAQRRPSRRVAPCLLRGSPSGPAAGSTGRSGVRNGSPTQCPLGLGRLSPSCAASSSFLQGRHTLPPGMLRVPGKYMALPLGARWLPGGRVPTSFLRSRTRQRTGGCSQDQVHCGTNPVRFQLLTFCLCIVHKSLGGEASASLSASHIADSTDASRTNANERSGSGRGSHSTGSTVSR